MVRSCPFPSRPGIPRTSLPISVAYNNHEPDLARVIKLKGARLLPVELPGVPVEEPQAEPQELTHTLTAS
jgi:hypothetical protein